MTMQEAMAVYFGGEKSAGLFIAFVGIAALLAAVIFPFARPALRSFGVTLGILAILEIALGAGLVLRTGSQVAALNAQLGADPAAFYANESARMTRVQRNFVIIEVVEVALIVLCAIGGVVLKSRPAVAGIALALLVHASILLAFDVIAERRGAAYLRALTASGSSS